MQQLDSDGRDDRLEAIARSCELIGRAWKGLPTPLRWSAGALIALPVVVIYGAVGVHLSPMPSWL